MGMMLEFKEVGVNEIEEIQELFYGVFTIEPWYDDWSNEKQLRLYLMDLIGQKNSLTYGLYDGNRLIGISMGHIKHWYSGVEYHIDEFLIRTEIQGNGFGTHFLSLIEDSIRKKGITRVTLQTDSELPAYEFYRKNDYYEIKEYVSFEKEL